VVGETPSERGMKKQNDYLSFGGSANTDRNPLNEKVDDIRKRVEVLEVDQELIKI